jgi:hypothetical protein
LKVVSAQELLNQFFASAITVMARCAVKRKVSLAKSENLQIYIVRKESLSFRSVYDSYTYINQASSVNLTNSKFKGQHTEEIPSIHGVALKMLDIL